MWTPEDAIEPPEDLEKLARLTTISPIRRSCIAAIVQNTVGLGVRIAPREGHEEEGAEDDPTKAMATLDALARQDQRSRRPNFTQLMARVKWDEQEVGNGYLEISRNRVDGKIDGLFHAPGKRVRRRQGRDGWIIGPRKGPASERTFFYDFGDKVTYANGEPTGKLARQGRKWDVNELIAFQLYTSESRDYGLPPDLQLAWDYLGDKLAAESNLGFFDSSGVPPTLIFVQGEAQNDEGDTVRFEVSQATVEKIADTVRTSGPSRKRVALVPVPPGTRTDKHDLAVLSERDMGFVNYRSDNRRRTLGAWRLSPVFVADIEDAGRYTAEVERAITKEQVFDPEQERWQDMLSETLLRDLGFGHLQLEFVDIAIDSDAARRDSATSAAEVGVITQGEYRQAHGLPPLSEAEEGTEPEPGQVPFGWNNALVQPTPPRLAAQLPGQAPAQPQEEVEKESLQGELERELREDFSGAIEDALGRVARLAGEEFELAPVVIEKDGSRIVVTPQNGDAPQRP